MTVLFVAWQDPEERTWRPVGRLSFEDGFYKFCYTLGAKESKRFIPFGRMKDIEKEYQSNSLFPLFANRLLSKSRPEYKDYIKWLDLGKESEDPLLVLSRTGGQRKTDSMHVYQCPSKTKNGTYNNQFFIHGLRYLPDNSIEAANNLKIGDQAFLMLDIQNSFHPNAVAVRTEKPKNIIGYCPRYISDDIRKLVFLCDQKNIQVTVKKVNLDAPIQLRLLCSINAPWPESFQPCNNREFLPIRPTLEQNICFSGTS